MTAEEHQIGGLGFRVGSAIFDSPEFYGNTFLFGMVGVNDRLGDSGALWELVKEFEMAAVHITAMAKELFDNKKY